MAASSARVAVGAGVLLLHLVVAAALLRHPRGGDGDAAGQARPGSVLLLPGAAVGRAGNNAGAAPTRRRRHRREPAPASFVVRPLAVPAFDVLPLAELYLPRSRLTVAPTALSAPVLGPLLELGRAAPVSTACTLYISRVGTVDLVDCAPAAGETHDDVPLGERLYALRFAPGQLDGRAVAAQIRVELRADPVELR